MSLSRAAANVFQQEVQRAWRHHFSNYPQQEALALASELPCQIGLHGVSCQRCQQQLATYLTLTAHPPFLSAYRQIRAALLP